MRGREGGREGGRGERECVVTVLSMCSILNSYILTSYLCYCIILSLLSRHSICAHVHT